MKSREILPGTLVGLSPVAGGGLYLWHVGKPVCRMSYRSLGIVVARIKCMPNEGDEVLVVCNDRMGWNRTVFFEEA